MSDYVRNENIMLEGDNLFSDFLSSSVRIHCGPKDFSIVDAIQHTHPFYTGYNRVNSGCKHKRFIKSI